MLTPIDEEGTPLIRRVIQTWTGALFDELIVVVRPEDAAEIEKTLDFFYAAAAKAAADISKSGVRLVENPNWSRGMFTSVKAGLAAVAEAGRTTHVAVSPADLPFLSKDSLRRMKDAAAALDERTLAVPTYGGRRGHPLLFAASLIPRILSWPDDRRLSSLFEEPDLSVLHVDVGDEAILRDVDRPDDLSFSSPSKKNNLTA